MKTDQLTLTQKAIELLKQLISIPSFSGEEDKTGDAIETWLQDFGVKTERQVNNVYAFNKHFDEAKPTLLLNSHHDTVKPNSAYTKDPFHPHVEDRKLYGLGSNDAGGCLVSLLATFVHFYEAENLSHNIIMAATAEEENAGEKSLRGLLPILPKIDVAIVGEPTLLDLAIAEKGLVVFDAVVEGTPSHAAHPNTNNSIYNTIDVLNWFKNYTFDKVSDALGEVKHVVSLIQQHAVDFVYDCITIVSGSAYVAVVEAVHQHISLKCCRISVDNVLFIGILSCFGVGITVVTHLQSKHFKETLAFFGVALSQHR